MRCRLSPTEHLGHQRLDHYRDRAAARVHPQHLERIVDLLGDHHPRCPDHVSSELIMMGVEEPAALIHAPNESVAPSEIQSMALAEALFLQRYPGASGLAHRPSLGLSRTVISPLIVPAAIRMSTVAPTVDAGNVRPSHAGGGGRNVVTVDNRSDVRDFLA